MEGFQSMSSLEREWRIQSYWDWVIYTDVETYLDTREDWDRHPVWGSAYAAHLENLADHHRFFLQLWSQKEQGFLQARQSSRELKKAVWRYKGQDGVAQSNLRHMEFSHWGQKGDLLKDEIKLKEGERRGEVPPVEWGIMRDRGYLQSQRQDKQQAAEIEQQIEKCDWNVYVSYTYSTPLICLMH